MSSKPRTPEHFPKMKHRAAKRLDDASLLWFANILLNVDLKFFSEELKRVIRSAATLGGNARAEIDQEEVTA